MTEAPARGEAGPGPGSAAEPQQRVGRRWIALIALANLGLYLAYLGPISVLLPDQSVSTATVHITSATYWPNGQWEDPERVILAEDAEETGDPSA